MLLDWESDGIGAALGLVLYSVILLLFVLPRVRRNPVLARLLPLALLWHLVVWAFTAFWMLPYYSAAAGADAYGYHTEGIAIASLIRAGDWGSINWGWNTAAMQLITGFVYTPLGGDVYGMLFFSAALGLCGCLYFCLAFSLWASPAQIRRYAVIILFLPSFAMWTGILGKDSWMALGLGLAAYGYSSIVKSHSSAGFWHVLFGLLLVTVIRPHVAVVLAASMAFAYVLGLAHARRVSILVKVQVAIVFIATLALISSAAQGFLGLQEVSADSLQEYGQSKGEGNDIGGSAVEIQAAPGVAGTILAFPRGIVRVLFQPFPWEVHNVNSGLAAVENLFILWFALSHITRIRELFRGVGSEPYVLFSFMLALGLLFIFSLTPNLGLLSRERAQLLPFVFGPLVAAEAVRKRRARPVRFSLPPESLYEPDLTAASLQPAPPSALSR